MATFRILYNGTVVLKDKKFEDYEKFQNLKNEIIDKCKNTSGLSKITRGENFVLKLRKDKNNPDLYFPDDLSDGFFNNKTFNYLKEKIALRDIKKNYKFELVKVAHLPKWERKPFNILLENALENVFQPILEGIQKDVSLSKLEASQIEYTRMKNELEENEKKLNHEHENTICNNCFETNIRGKRFICSECINYNLCQKCEKKFFQKQIHNRKHVFIQVNKPLSKENDVIKYNNIITDNNIIEKTDLREIIYKSNCMNNGSTKWKGCYILPVRYGDEYLTCEPFKIDEDVDLNGECKIILKIQVPNTNKKYYEGYFRMFTPDGLPFGQVITIKVVRGE